MDTTSQLRCGLRLCAPLWPASLHSDREAWVGVMLFGTRPRAESWFLPHFPGAAASRRHYGWG
uniref:Uncharacterized protein n=1 Tax=Oryza barthii TaxID=65489 RepID=A0A0D3HK65_9ORYZ